MRHQHFAVFRITWPIPSPVQLTRWDVEEQARDDVLSFVFPDDSIVLVKTNITTTNLKIN